MREVFNPRSERALASAPKRARAQAVEMEEEPLGDRLLAFLRTYPLEIAVAVLLAVAAGAVAWNALALQKRLHPAPLFGRGEAAVPALRPPVRPVPEAAEVPAALPVPPATVTVPVTPPPRQPAMRETIVELIRASEPPPLPVARPANLSVAPRPTPIVITPQPRQSPMPPHTTIGDLVRLGDAPPIPPALVGKVDPSRLVASGQRALIKLGYGPMKADGIIGPGTRQMIERFERDRRLPITGELTPRTARELTAASGLPVEE